MTHPSPEVREKLISLLWSQRVEVCHYRAVPQEKATLNHYAAEVLADAILASGLCRTPTFDERTMFYLKDSLHILRSNGTTEHADAIERVYEALRATPPSATTAAPIHCNQCGREFYTFPGCDEYVCEQRSPPSQPAKGE